MCGINLKVWKDKSCEFCHAVFSHNCDKSSDSQEDNIETVTHDDNLRRRGPDAYGNVTSIEYPGYYRIQCAASVLQMRAELQKQPVSFVPVWKDSDDNNNQHETDEENTAYLCWNGEIYQQTQSNLREQSETNSFNPDEAFAYNVSDTTMVANHLREPMVMNDFVQRHSCGDPISRRASAQHYHISIVMSRFYNAEFAFCVLTKHGVYFGRDLWGRRSLLRWDCPRNCGSFQIVSVTEESSPTATVMPETTPIPLTEESSPQKNNSLALDWTEIPPGMVHCILFSDHTTKIPCSEYPKVQFPLMSLPKNFPVPPMPQETNTSETIGGISERLWRLSLDLEFCLRKAVSIRLDQSSERRSTGVLFSGGVDSVVLAALAADVLSSQHKAEKRAILESRAEEECPQVPILYLYNVSFGPNPEKSADRKAALKSYEALRAKHYKRSQADRDRDQNETGANSRDGDDDCDVKIIFRDIIVEWDDICRSEPHIRTLISPKSTVMDANIATALWFASGGKVVGNQAVNESNCPGDDERPPRVLLLGMGADELMGGYGRHRKAYEKGGWDELKAELKMDQDRLWERNCGRDDRLCSDHGREARFPFLDAHVVSLLQETMAKEDGLVCDFNLPPGVGDKRVLRLVAKRLGMEHASGLVKRAIQFGSRISHVSDKKRFGSRRKAKGVTKI